MTIEKLFEVAKSKGISDVQVFLSHKNELSIEVFAGNLEKYEISDSTSLVVRGIYQQKMASYSTEVLDDSMIDSIVSHLIENAKIIDSPDEAIMYAGDDHYEELKDLYRPSLSEWDVSNKIDMVKALDQKIHSADDRVSIVETMYSEETKEVLLQNTKGLKLYNKVNGAMVGAQVIVKNDVDQRTNFDLIVSNDINDFQFDDLVQEMVSDATNSLGAKPIPSGNYPIVFKNTAFATLLAAFAGVFSAESVQKGYSLLKGKLNTVIGAPIVTLVDDPFLKKSHNSRSFDDEGVATKYKELIKNGTLTTYLHNLTTAKKDNVTSTGNGFNGSVSPINLVLLPGEQSKDDLIAAMKDGLFITDVQGAHAGANSVSGDFSLQAMGYLIQNGQKTKPVALITVAGNFIELLKHVEAIGSDSKKSYFGITCPSIKVGPMVVSGL